ncbi:peptidase [Roseofilum reptotaenium CS-1145]|nr:peptidase [Roseofilum reptotaenium]MDB9515515.1 peptidase [Roseofilum reptotaenium CS-1145]
MAPWRWIAKRLNLSRQGLCLRSCMGMMMRPIAYAIATVLLAVFSCTTILALPPRIRVSPPQAHPLPPLLAQWHDPEELGDYFEAIKPLKIGYLIWSQFPVQVGLDIETPDPRWVEAVTRAIQEWQAYFPLEISDRPDQAHIIIHRQRPPLKLGPDGQLGRVRSATTNYELYLGSLPHPPDREYLLHRCEIFLTPNQTSEYTLATARHELGHAIGIWGHSPEPTDALYFSQVPNPPPISSRDLNTLKRIYQQPTHLGWPVPSQHSRLWGYKISLPTLPSLQSLPTLPPLPMLPALPKLPQLPKLPPYPKQSYLKVGGVSVQTHTQ